MSTKAYLEFIGCKLIYWGALRQHKAPVCKKDVDSTRGERVGGWGSRTSVGRLTAPGERGRKGVKIRGRVLKRWETGVGQEKMMLGGR